METYTWMNPTAPNESKLPVPPSKPKPKAKMGSGGSSKTSRRKQPSLAPSVGKTWDNQNANLSYGTYIASHPQLLDEINLIIDRGLARIGKTCGGDNADRKSSGPETESVVRTTLDKDKVEIQKGEA